MCSKEQEREKDFGVLCNYENDSREYALEKKGKSAKLAKNMSAFWEQGQINFIFAAWFCYKLNEKECVIFKFSLIKQNMHP